MYGFMIYCHEQKINTYCRIEHQQKPSAMQQQQQEDHLSCLQPNEELK